MVVNLGGKIEGYLDRTETLKRYFDDIRKYDILTKEEEMALLKIYKEGNPRESKKAKDKLINTNQRFVVAVAKRFGTNDNLLDLINEGNLALMEALETYDLNQGVRFMSWAVWFIRRAMNTYNVDYGTLVKKNNHAKTYHLISKATNDFVQREGREPTSEELFELLNEKYNANLKDFKDVTPTRINSIDESFGNEDDESNLGDIALYNSYSASTNNYEKDINDDYIHNMISSLLSILTPREQKIIKLAFGIDCYREYETQEIAKEVGLTTERVRQMKASIIARMKTEYAKRIAKTKK